MSASCFFSRLTAFTLQVMLSPAVSFSVASLMNSFEISETCSRPSVEAPTSTNAPYDITDLIFPSSSTPTSSCSSGVFAALALGAGASSAAATTASAGSAAGSASQSRMAARDAGETARAAGRLGAHPSCSAEAVDAASTSEAATHRR